MISLADVSPQLGGDRHPLAYGQGMTTILTPRTAEISGEPTRLEVDQTLWTAPGSAPETHAEVSWTPEALTCRLVTRESNPRTTYHEPNDPVHKDSCLEWFLAPWPGSPGTHDANVADAPGHWYLNLETNSDRTLYAAFGTPEHRTLLDDELRALISTIGEVGPEEWAITWIVPVELINRLGEEYGLPEVVLQVGVVLGANFYKCGDDTDVPHYAAWNPIQADTPQFHRPDQFGRLMLT